MEEDNGSTKPNFPLAVWFNQEAYSLYEELKKKGLVSQNFNDFVRSAFYDKIDEIRLKKR